MNPRLLALGDPQAPFTRFQDVLRRHDALDASGDLAEGVSFLSMGDHFDFAAPEGWDLANVGDQGVQILDWLDRQPSGRAMTLAGNHDVSRVMELAHLSDEDFAQARDLAATGPKEDFQNQFPAIPSPGIALRDYAAFSVQQRERVQSLLLSGRMVLAAAVETPGGHAALATHAAVTSRELMLLGIPGERDPVCIAEALNGLLAARLEAVRPKWENGETAALSLWPVHRAGTSGQEGGGLLYHRPQTLPMDAWGQRGNRRYQPTALPKGLLQICGHTHHEKAAALMADIAPSVDAVGGRLRSLVVDADGVRYVTGLVQPAGEQATLWMTDGRLSHNDDVEMLELTAFLSPRM
ncbi:MAG: hypothetical protein AAFV53_43180 [Myxococcota bacterium]